MLRTATPLLGILMGSHKGLPWFSASARYGGVLPWAATPSGPCPTRVPGHLPSQCHKSLRGTWCSLNLHCSLRQLCLKPLCVRHYAPRFTAYSVSLQTWSNKWYNSFVSNVEARTQRLDYFQSENVTSQSGSPRSLKLLPVIRNLGCAFPDSSVTKNSPASEGDMGSTSDLGRSHMRQSN